jgi:diguanylate cyclase (GGDEF)-like protein
MAERECDAVPFADLAILNSSQDHADGGRGTVPPVEGTVLRSLRVPAIVAGVSLVTAAVAMGVINSRASQSLARTRDGQLTAVARQESTSLTQALEQVRTIDLMMAHQPAFANFITDPRPHALKLHAGGNIQQIDDSLRFLSQLLPGQLDSAGFADIHGVEVARYSQGVTALSDSLGSVKHKPYFTAPLLEGRGAVYRTDPFQSDVSQSWVLGYSTLVSGNGVGAGVVYFTITLDSLRTKMLGAVQHGETLRVFDAQTGQVLMDSRVDEATLLAVSALGSKPAMADDLAFVGVGDAASRTGVMSAHGTRLAFSPVANGQQDVRSGWIVVASQPEVGVSGWLGSMGLLALALLVAGVGLVALGFKASLRLNRNIRLTAEQHLHQSLHDPLTGLPNRALFADRGQRAIASAKRSGGSAAVLLIDLDHFKEVNDTLGHPAGDQLLIILSGRLRAAVREIDTVARLGGDEFGIVLPDVASSAAAVAAAERILDSWSDPVQLDGVNLQIEGSIGVALYPDHGETHDHLLQRADVAMYGAKQAHTSVVVYDPASNKNTPRRLAMLGELRHAIEHDQLVVHYQPKAELTTGRICGAEALVRWQHPTLGLLPPADFIPLAEASALIHPLTRLVIRAALTQQASWTQAGHIFPVAVNVSTRCLLAPNFVQDVQQLLSETGAQPGCLELEITESVILADPARALSALTELHALGLTISIDDFGTGYSSLAYLKVLPVDELKIDRSFVRDMRGHPDDAVIVQAIVDLGRNLGLRVVAEGIEDRTTWEYLQGIGCDVGQGFHLSRPVEPLTLTQWLDQQASAASTQSLSRSGI